MSAPSLEARKDPPEMDALRAMYERGDYCIKPPPVDHSRWDDEAWINYIEAGGGHWHEENDAKPEGGCTS